MEFTKEEIRAIEAALTTEQLRFEEIVKKNSNNDFVRERYARKNETIEKIFDKLDEEKTRLFLLKDIEEKIKG